MIVYVKKDDDHIPVEVSKQSEIDNLVAVHGADAITTQGDSVVENDVVGVEPAVLDAEPEGEPVFTSKDEAEGSLPPSDV